MNIDTLGHLLLDRTPAVFIVGNDGPRSRALELQARCEALAEAVSGFVLHTPDAPNHARRGSATDFGPWSFGGTPEAREVVKHAPLVLAVDNHLRGFATQNGKSFEGKSIVYLGGEPLSACLPGVVVEGDPLAALEQLQRFVTAESARKGCVFAQHPRQVLRVLNELLPERALLFVEITAAGLAFAGQELRMGPSQHLYQDVEVNGCMGEMFGLSVGARHAASEDWAVVCLIGDGALRMVPNGELHTLLGFGSYLLICLENSGFAFVEQGVRQVRGTEHGIPLGKWQKKPDFAALGQVWGGSGRRCRSVAELRRQLALVFAAHQPAVIEVPIDTFYDAPIGDRADVIGEAFGH